MIFDTTEYDLDSEHTVMWLDDNREYREKVQELLNCVILLIFAFVIFIPVVLGCNVGVPCRQ